MRSSRGKAAAALFISLILGIGCGVALRHLRPAGGWGRGGPGEKAGCGEGGDASGRDIPSALQGFCPELFPRQEGVLRIGAKPRTTLKKIGQTIREGGKKKIRTLLIDVKDSSGRLRVIPLDLPVARKKGAAGQCAAMRLIEFPWIPPAEPSIDPMAVQICPGAEMFSSEEGGCLRFSIAAHPAEQPQSGGGCRSPSKVLLLGVEPAGGRKLRVSLGAAGAPVEVKGPAEIRRIIWNTFTLSQRLDLAFVMVLDPERGGTLQDLVDIVGSMLWKSAPPADRLWIKGWEAAD